ncbi:hypothetical protein WJX82_000746 [Trebouxia sp. C0006]
MDAMEEDQPFELEAYAGNYVSHARVDRLLFIARSKQGTAFGEDALRLALEELSQSDDTQRYQEVALKFGRDTANRAQIDQKERKAAQRHDRLEAELNNYKTNLIKESIRMGHNDMGDFYYGRGDLQNAFKSYVRTRDYCTTGKHVIQMCLNVIKVSIELGNYVHVNNYISKAEQTPEVQDPVVAGKLKAAAGLAFLQAKKYKQAAKRFTEVPNEMGTQYHDVLSAQDVAVYGGLCALASFDRHELRNHVINNVSFRDYMEVNPEVRELVNDFYGSRYASCLSHLTKLRPMLELDLHAHVHLNTLYAAIRSRALVQYTTPFTSVNLPTMAEAFKTDVSGLEKELAELIQTDQIQARIDSHNKVLYARHADQRKATFQSALRTAEQGCFLCSCRVQAVQSSQQSSKKPAQQADCEQDRYPHEDASKDDGFFPRRQPGTFPEVKVKNFWSKAKDKLGFTAPEEAESTGIEFDPLRDGPLRYLGYANECGEAFAAWLPPLGVPLSYAVAISYVLVDTYDKGQRAYSSAEKELGSRASLHPEVNTGRLVKLLSFERAMDTVVWQLLASVVCPGYTIHTVVALAHAGLIPLEHQAAVQQAFQQCAPVLNTSPETFTQLVDKSLPTMIGLGAIPFIVHPIDNGIHALMNASFRPAIRKFICGPGQGNLADLDMCEDECNVPEEGQANA